MTKSSSEAGRVAPERIYLDAIAVSEPRRAGAWSLQMIKDDDIEYIRAPVAPLPSARGEALAMSGRWRRSQGQLFCGTMRIMRQDFDTDPCQEVRDATLDAICKAMNRHHGESAAPPLPTLPAGTGVGDWRKCLAEVEEFKSAVKSSELYHWFPMKMKAFSATLDRLAAHLEEAHAREGRAKSEAADQRTLVRDCRPVVEAALEMIKIAKIPMLAKAESRRQIEMLIGRIRESEIQKAESARAALAPTTTNTGEKA